MCCFRYLGEGGTSTSITPILLKKCHPSFSGKNPPDLKSKGRNPPLVNTCRCTSAEASRNSCEACSLDCRLPTLASWAKECAAKIRCWDPSCQQILRYFLEGNYISGPESQDRCIYGAWKNIPHIDFSTAFLMNWLFWFTTKIGWLKLSQGSWNLPPLCHVLFPGNKVGDFEGLFLALTSWRGGSLGIGGVP